MPGWLTNDLGLVSAPTLNGVAQTAPNGTFSNVGPGVLFPGDTQLAGGSPPQSVAATAFQIAAQAMGLINNNATSTVHAATLNTVDGLITTEALTTAAGATYTFTLTNSLLTTSVPAPQVQMHSGTNTAGGIAVTSVTNGSGNCVIVFTNTGSAAWNGTMLIGFHV